MRSLILGVLLACPVLVQAQGAAVTFPGRETPQEFKDEQYLEGRFYLHGTSHHFGNKKYNQNNYGFGVGLFKGNWGIQHGVYHNSLGRTSWYSLLSYRIGELRDWEFGIVGGIASGYNIPVAPVVMPYVRTPEIFPKTSLLLTAIPNGIHREVEGVVTLSIEINMGVLK